MAKVGDRVRIPWFEGGSWEKKPHRVPDLFGTIRRIIGAYHYVKIENNDKYNILELYSVEFEVVP